MNALHLTCSSVQNKRTVRTTLSKTDFLAQFGARIKASRDGIMKSAMIVTSYGEQLRREAHELLVEAQRLVEKAAQLLDKSGALEKKVSRNGAKSDK
jgi:hypothetical protein